jgi:CRP/FNR family transcriptional regulator, cyclic AMP receptor protein
MIETQTPSVGRFRFVPHTKRVITTPTSIRAPYGLKIIENCITCPHHEDQLFCNLSPAAVQHLSTITHASSYPKGATLFLEGQAGRGVFILCSGRVKLSTSSIDGRTLIVRLSEPGEVLGLPATVTGTCYELTAEVVEPTQANFVSTEDFLNFLREYGDVSLKVAQQLGQTYHAAVAEMRSIGLSHSAREKLARFILDLPTDHKPGKGADTSRLTLTHEEIAQMIGTSRETVTRAFTDFKKKNLLIVKGSTLTIKDRSGLERLVQGQTGTGG